MLQCSFWRCIFALMKTVLSPKENRWATVCRCVYIFDCACLHAERLAGVCSLQAHIRTDVSDLGDSLPLLSSAICRCLFLSFLVHVSFVSVRPHLLLEDLVVWSTQRINKSRALAVETDVLVKSKDPFNLSKPIQLSLLASLSQQRPKPPGNQVNLDS